MKLTDNDYLIRDTFKNNEVYMFYTSVKSDRFFAWLSGVVQEELPFLFRNF